MIVSGLEKSYNCKNVQKWLNRNIITIDKVRNLARQALEFKQNEQPTELIIVFFRKAAFDGKSNEKNNIRKFKKKTQQSSLSRFLKEISLQHYKDYKTQIANKET